MQNSFYREIINDHNLRPAHKHTLENANMELRGVNPSCGDEMVLRLRLSEDGSTIEEAAFTGSGCAVSQASADIMAELITGESVSEAKRLSELFIRMIQGEDLDADEQEDLDEAYELESISRMPARVKCAELAWRTLDSMF